VQIAHERLGRRVARVEGEKLAVLRAETVYAVVTGAATLEECGEDLDYGAVHTGASEWRLLPPIDHPEPARCMVSGTGLTHLKSAQSRGAMHSDEKPVAVTDSMKMYEWGVQGGRPAAGEIGVQPEWFYKGTGLVLRGHGDALAIPEYAVDGGDEAEIAGVYVIDAEGRPVRVGFTQGNEFSDHKMERMNYLYLAPSKLRQCSIGPELVLGASFEEVRGVASVRRGGEVVWSKPLSSGEKAMCHTLENLEHHHFKYAQHRRPGDVHVHYFGAGSFSFSDGVELKDGDVMSVSFEGFGRPLENRVGVVKRDPALHRVKEWA
jgi:hypothetical protein